MLQICPSARIFVCNQLVDFRKGIDGLAAVCRNKLDQDPYQGVLFIFEVGPSLFLLACLGRDLDILLPFSDQF